MGIIRANFCMSNIKNVLVTGGAGFIGSHITDRLIEKGYRVRVFDNLNPQVHPNGKPSYLNSAAEFMQGDVTNREDVVHALEGMDAVYHEAAAVGVGQSMYQVAHYVAQNCVGTGMILDVLANQPHQIKHLIVASSNTGYGEGLYTCSTHGSVRPPLRDETQMQKKEWEPRCPQCQDVLKPIGIVETESFAPNSLYALTKQMQEELFLIFGNAYGIPATAFRYFNVYGPRQSLSNPYTGVAAIFLSRLKNGNAPVIYEDGLQTRDFISVYDIADANVRALEVPEAAGQVFNLGTGRPFSILEMARTLSTLLGKTIEPEITQTFRTREVRHCTADISKAKRLLGWEPQWTFERGMQDLMAWGEKEEAKDMSDQAQKELLARGLLKT